MLLRPHAADRFCQKYIFVPCLKLLVVRYWYPVGLNKMLRAAGLKVTNKIFLPCENPLCHPSKSMMFTNCRWCLNSSQVFGVDDKIWWMLSGAGYQALGGSIPDISAPNDILYGVKGQHIILLWHVERCVISVPDFSSPWGRKDSLNSKCQFMGMNSSNVWETELLVRGGKEQVYIEISFIYISFFHSCNSLFEIGLLKP